MRCRADGRRGFCIVTDCTGSAQRRGFRCGFGKRAGPDAGTDAGLGFTIRRDASDGRHGVLWLGRGAVQVVHGGHVGDLFRPGGRPRRGAESLRGCNRRRVSRRRMWPGSGRPKTKRVGPEYPPRDMGFLMGGGGTTDHADRGAAGARACPRTRRGGRTSVPPTACICRDPVGMWVFRRPAIPSASCGQFPRRHARRRYPA